MAAAQTIASTLEEWAAEGRLRTAIMEGVKKVSVIDVICASKECSIDTANSTYRRMLEAGAIKDFARASCPCKEGRGGAREPIPVASAEEVVQLLHALPGESLGMVRPQPFLTKSVAAACPLDTWRPHL